jgi:D-alanyl-D-alanine endopeptidase (penicillin-binding protein 7)
MLGSPPARSRSCTSFSRAVPVQGGFKQVGGDEVVGLGVSDLKTAGLAVALALGVTGATFAQSSAKASGSAAATSTSRTTVRRAADVAATPHFRRDDQGNLVPDIRAAAAIAYDSQTGEVLWEQHSRDERSIASLTKLMTAVTFVSDDPDLNQRVTVTRADMRNASTTYLKAGDVVSYNDLLHLALMPSDNAAARVLARTSPGGTDVFVTRMNLMATHLGLTNTHYADPSGLDPDDVSCALDLARVITHAAADTRLGPIMRTAEYDVHAASRTFTVRSTDRLLGTDLDVLGGKTGFITKSGYCLATLLQIPQGPQVAVVILGAANSALRFGEARHLFNWLVGRAQGLSGGTTHAGHHN